MDSVKYDTTSGGLEREHNIHSRGDWEGNVAVELRLGLCSTIGVTRPMSALVTFYAR